MFEKLTSFTKKVGDLADRPSLNATELKAQFDAAPDETRVYLNKLIDALKSITAGDSGAKNIGVTAISGLTGTDIQTILASLKTLVDNVDKKTPVSGKSSTISLNVGASQDFVITYPAGRFTDTPSLALGLYNTDIEGAYTTSKSIIANTKDGATIRLKNKGTTIQYIIVYWIAHKEG